MSAYNPPSNSLPLYNSSEFSSSSISSSSVQISDIAQNTQYNRSIYDTLQTTELTSYSVVNWTKGQNYNFTPMYFTGSTSLTNGYISVGTNGSSTAFGYQSILSYYPGAARTAEVRFGVQFPTSTIGNLSFVGIANQANNGFGCGYNPNTGNFAMIYYTGGKAQIAQLVITTAATTSANCTVTLNSVAYTVALTNASTDKNFTGFQIANSISTSAAGLWICDAYTDGAGNYYVDFVAPYDGPQNGTYSFSAGTTGAVATMNMLTVGVSRTYTYIDQASFNGNPGYSASIDKTKWNTFALRYSYSGNFVCNLCAYTGNQAVVLHSLNVNTTTINPQMLMSFWTQRISGSSDTSINVAAASVYYEDRIQQNSVLRNFYSADITVPASTNTLCLLNKIRSQINGQSNYAVANAVSFQAYNSNGTKDMQFLLFTSAPMLGAATVSNYPSMTLYDSSSGLLNGDMTKLSTITTTGEKVLYNIFCSPQVNTQITLPLGAIAGPPCNNIPAAAQFYYSTFVGVYAFTTGTGSLASIQFVAWENL